MQIPGIVLASLEPVAPAPSDLGPAAEAKNPDELNPYAGDRLFYAYLVPGAIYQALDGSQWRLVRITENGLYAVSNIWYPRGEKLLTRDELRQTIESWIDPVLQHVPPPRPQDLQNP